jgi:hypothetical protein
MKRVTVALISAFVTAKALSAAHQPPVSDNEFIDDLSHRSFRYFLEQTNPQTGLTLDRASTDGRNRYRNIGNISASGFALSALCIGQEHHWIGRAEAERRANRTLEFFVRRAARNHGWFYHFMDAQTGARTPDTEISSIDTAILLAGALTARGCFQDDPETVSLVTELFDAVDFPWMMNGSQKYFSLGWTPEWGFSNAQWASYSELLILYVLGIGSPTHPISATVWDQWQMPIVSEGGYTFIYGGPLFIYQYPLAWIDLRGRFLPPGVFGPMFHANYLLNAEIATRAQREAFRTLLARRFPGYSKDVWGLTSSDSPSGYLDWGGTIDDPRIDGTVAPAAAAGSAMLTPDICLPALQAMRKRYGEKIYGRYGFVDAFNPTTGWVSGDVLGIEAGITLLSAENLRTGSVWRWFMSNPEPERALDLAGLVDVRHPYENYRIDPQP